MRLKRGIAAKGARSIMPCLQETMVKAGVKTASKASMNETATLKLLIPMAFPPLPTFNLGCDKKF